MQNQEQIVIKSLEVSAHIGVPEEERAEPQKLWVDIKMTADRTFAEMQDEVELTIDYAAVVNAVEKLAAARPRKLIETLASDIRDLILSSFGAKSVQVRVKKRILPQTKWVAVEVRS
jgi:7,8-dihydroneopterin aldolase/epimerase/oxygenase